jgi:hypothetical protein
MARISFSSLIEEIVGKLAGSVFQDSYGGWQVRTRVTPRNPRSTYQQLRRGEFGFLSSSWRNLTSTQRQTFIDAAITPPAALNLYLQSNINLTLVNEPTITDYVPSTDPGTMTIEIDNASPADFWIKATGGVTTVPAGAKLLLLVTALKQPTRIFNNISDYSPILSFDEGTDLSIPVNILSEWQSRYGILSADKRLCLKSALIVKANGLRGASLINCTITEEMANKYIPKATLLTDEANTTTAPENIWPYVMPANTLVNNGDIILYRVDYRGNSTGAGNSYGYAVASGSGNQIFSTSSFDFNHEITVIRTASDKLRFTSRIISDFVQTAIITRELTSIDFTSPITISLQVVANVIGDVVVKWGSVDLVKAP